MFKIARCTEITPEKAKEIFATKEVFAYDENEVDWKLETEADLIEAIGNHNVLFIENE